MRLRLAAVVPLLLLLGCDDGDTDASTTAGASTGETASENAPSTTASSDTAGPSTTSGSDPTTGPTATTQDPSGPTVDTVTDTATTSPTDPTGDTDDTSGPGSDSDDDSSSTGGGDQNPPMGAAALVPWLEAGEYTQWQAESAIHDSDGPHFGDVRTFVNTVLFDSLTEGAATHPQTAAVVKELYGDGPAVRGWAVMVKTEAGAGGDTWYWLEIYDGTTYADGVGDGLCVDCHSEGQDHVRSPFPLQ